MSRIISATEQTLSAIFSRQYDFVIPPYQRPYAWTTDEAEELFDDLHGFHQQVARTQSFGNSAVSAPYFLGSVVLVKEDDKPRSLVVDGQQRLTTLTILLSAMASRMDVNSQARSELEGYVRERGHEIQKLAPKPRLALRERDREFFMKSIQRFDFDWLANQSHANDAQRNIQANGALLRKLLSKKFPGAPEDVAAMLEFASTVMLNCYLVAVSTPSEQSAFRIFTVLNTRGLDLLPTDILKADVIGGIPDNIRDEYSRKWEQLEEMVGRGGFRNLFEHMRMIHVKDKMRRSLLEEFKEHVLDKMSADKAAFVDGDLTDYAEAYRVAKKRAYQSPDGAQDDVESVNASLYWLNNWIDNSDWLPSAILFLKQKPGCAKYAAWFFRKLERLAAFHLICARNVNQRVARHAQIISAMEKGHSLESPIKEIELDDSEKREMKSTLGGEIYGPTVELRPARRNYAILRLDRFVADAGAEYDRRHLTIEHVLPQTVRGGEWAETWPDENLRRQWVGRIANLVPLNRRRNSAASNYGFCDKKEKYFSRGATPYTLTSKVLLKNEWTPEVVERRQEELLRIYAEKWELD